MDSLVILGCGFTGSEVARQALARGMNVVATTRSPDRASELHRLGVVVHVSPTLSRESVAEIVPQGARVLVAFSPDGRTDTEVAPSLAAAEGVVYISTTGVYGSARGRVDESTPVDATKPRAADRLAAERVYLDRGATILRAAGIYGPGRGLHRRLMAGDFHVPGNGDNVVSRVHVTDLAALVLGVLDAARPVVRGQVFVVADDTPVPQIEAIRWLCERLAVPIPPSSPIEQVASTLRHDRAVDNARIKRVLSLTLTFPSYREGFEACLAAEGISRRG
jgi:nucleoside-diphosphate-sugar epimerase